MHIVTVQDSDNEVVDVFVVDAPYRPWLYPEVNAQLKAVGLRMEVYQSVDLISADDAKLRLASQAEDA